MLRVPLLAFLVLGLLSTSFGVHAQVPSTNSSISVTISPQNPRPFDQITVTVSSNLVNLSAGTISISKDGTVVSEGSRSTVIQMGGAGTKTTVSIKATVNGTVHTKTIVIRPAEVALVLEPDTTAHPFYEGGLLVAPESRVRLIALADLRTSAGARVPEAQLSYVWKFGTKTLNDQSGLGKSVLTATSPVRYRDAEISVTVSTQDGLQKATASTFVSSITPLVRIYRSDPLAGTLFDQALSGSYTLTSSEETFKAVPYFFGAVPSYAWQLNGNASGSSSLVTVRTTNAQKGTALLGVSAIVPSSGEQTQSRLTLQFGSGATNIFGF
jgi:hypothetical protein